MGSSRYSNTSFPASGTVSDIRDLLQISKAVAIRELAPGRRTSVVRIDNGYRALMIFHARLYGLVVNMGMYTAITFSREYSNSDDSC